LRWPLSMLAATLLIVASPVSFDVTMDDGVTLSPNSAFAGKGGGGGNGGGGKVRYETSFDIRGDFWRFWSTQLLPGDLAGQWQVEIVDESGAVLEARTLDYRPAG